MVKWSETYLSQLEEVVQLCQVILEGAESAFHFLHVVRYGLVDISGGFDDFRADVLRERDRIDRVATASGRWGLVR
jgi:hypothetical protein